MRDSIYGMHLNIANESYRATYKYGCRAVLFLFAHK